MVFCLPAVLGPFTYICGHVVYAKRALVEGILFWCCGSGWVFAAGGCSLLGVSVVCEVTGWFAVFVQGQEAGMKSAGSFLPFISGGESFFLESAVTLGVEPGDAHHRLCGSLKGWLFHAECRFALPGFYTEQVVLVVDFKAIQPKGRGLSPLDGAFAAQASDAKPAQRDLDHSGEVLGELDGLGWACVLVLWRILCSGDDAEPCMDFWELLGDILGGVGAGEEQP